MMRRFYKSGATSEMLETLNKALELVQAYNAANAAAAEATAVAWQDRLNMQRRCRRRLQRALKNGTYVMPETCSACGRPGALENHHISYDETQPLGGKIVALCRMCHAKTHAEMRAEMQKKFDKSMKR